MKYQWEQKIFTPKDFEGAGQYIIKEPRAKKENPFVSDTGFLSTIMYKIGYCSNVGIDGRHPYTVYSLISMSDGWVQLGYFLSKDENGKEIENALEWKWKSFGTLEDICDYLNNNIHKDTFRLATNEELIRVVAYQKWRTS